MKIFRKSKKKIQISKEENEGLNFLACHSFEHGLYYLYLWRHVFILKIVYIYIIDYVCYWAVLSFYVLIYFRDYFIEEENEKVTVTEFTPLITKKENVVEA